MMSAKEERPDVPESATQILDMIETFKDADHHERFVKVTTISFKDAAFIVEIFSSSKTYRFVWQVG